MTPSTLRTNCVSSVTEIGSEGDRGEGDNASCMTEGETKISKSNCCSKREDDWQIRVTEGNQIQVLSQERNFYLMFIHFKHVASCLLLIITNLKKILLYGPRDKTSIFSIPAPFPLDFRAFSMGYLYPTPAILTGNVRVQQKHSHQYPPVLFGFLVVSCEENVFSGAPNENIVQNHLNVALLYLF